MHGHGMAAVIAHHAFGLARGARGVEDIQRVGGRHGYAFGGTRRGHRLLPVDVAPGHERAALGLALDDDTARHLVRGQLQGMIQQGLVSHHPARLDTTGGRDHQLGRGVVDTLGQLRPGKAAEHHGMHRANTRAGQHGDDRLGHHRHIDDNPVAFFDPLIANRPGKPGHPGQELVVGQAGDAMGDRAVVDQRHTLAVPGLDVTITTVVAGVEGGSGKPGIERGRTRIQHAFGRAQPADMGGFTAPEILGVIASVFEVGEIACRRR